MSWLSPEPSTLPARIVFEAWAKPELFKRWWVPKSMGMSLLSCEMDVRVGGKYRFVFGVGGSKVMEVFGKYIEVTPHSRLMWTNEEGDEGGAVTTLTFEEKGGQTLLVKHDLYPSKEALDASSPPGRRMGCPRSSSNWTSFSSPWARAWHGHEVVEDACQDRQRQDRHEAAGRQPIGLGRVWRHRFEQPARAFYEAARAAAPEVLIELLEPGGSVDVTCYATSQMDAGSGRAGLEGDQTVSQVHAVQKVSRLIRSPTTIRNRS